MATPFLSPTGIAASPPSRFRAFLAGLLIVLSGLAAYHGSFQTPFIFDDAASILRNETIRSVATMLRPPFDEGQTVGGRPILNASFALNYALGRDRVWGYHLANLGVHLAAALLLFGIVRRTLAQVGLNAVARPAGARSSRWSGRDCLEAGCAVALVWAVHPLQTEAVTYVAQRAESMMGFFYLTTLYCFVRAAEAGQEGTPRAAMGWKAVSWGACLAGMATKEVMVTAPMLVWLYDRTFVAGSFRAAWRANRGYYFALGATWLLLIFLVAGAGNRGGTIGAAAGITQWQYLLCQSRAIVHYLRLAFWPAPLVFDYGPDPVGGLKAVLPFVAFDLSVLAATTIALWRRSVLGFLGAWFFGILVPTSSFVGGTRQMLAEHRMYLPLAAVVTFAVAGSYALWGRRSLAVILPVALVLGLATSARNRDYRSAVALYQDTVAKRPGNPWAHSNYGLALGEAAEPEAALRELDAALRLKPGLAEALYDRGVLLAKAGRTAEAIDAYEAALHSGPGMAAAHRNLSLLLLQTGRPMAAVAHARQYLLLTPEDADGHLALGNALVAAGGSAEAVVEYERALALDPGNGDAEYSLGFVLGGAGRAAEAVPHLERARDLESNSADKRYRLGLAFARLGRWTDAQAEFERAILVNPDFPDAQLNLGNCLMMIGRFSPAIVHYQRAAELRPGSAETHYDLANALFQSGRVAESAPEYETAIRLRPDFPDAIRNLASARQWLAEHSGARN